MGRAKKRLFISLVAGTSLTVILFLVLLWVVPYIGLGSIHPLAPWITGVLVAFAVLMVFCASVGLVLNLAFGKSLPLFSRIRGITVKLFLPLMTLLGRALGISKDQIKSSFVSVNNELVMSSVDRSCRPDQMLLLMPHCLQNSKCKMRLTYNINNCKRCGRCPIDGLLELSERYGIHLAVATGGTIARRIVVQRRPRMILACACERDLASGIQDTYPLPVYGVLNRRPNGPCLDTLVPMRELEAAVRMFMDPEYRPERRHSSEVPARPDTETSAKIVKLKSQTA
ncbi:MAG TPA: DUF116 domain-containing protein [Thermodesulfobacteriaceae bacterium]|nr:DUF116 domain-containing protein [Thermodesulfobacteriaceae bacterium]